MSYYTATKIDKPIAEAIARVEAVLKEEGFGVLTRIDVAATLKEKIGAELRPYVILGACNPKLAFEAIQREDKVGTMLPCNVIVQEIAPGQSEVAAIDPVASMQAIENPELLAIAQDVREKLRRVIERL
ncbi:DUF302 domain-containing protein [Rhodoblastus sp.]|uniref:DUF302 domain-containing protein n=1 Tax=Rhodoblastus sp. TaxID=1962975 RepID=UPI003F9B122C